MAPPNPNFKGTLHLLEIPSLMCPTCLAPLTSRVNKERRVVEIVDCCRTWPDIPVEALRREIPLIKYPEVRGIPEANPQQIIATKKVRERPRRDPGEETMRGGPTG